MYSRHERLPYLRRVMKAASSVGTGPSVPSGCDAAAALLDGVRGGRDGEHLLVGKDVLERVREPVDGRTVAPGDEVQMLTLEVEVHHAAACPKRLVGVVEDRR